MTANSRSVGVWSNASATTAWITDSLSGKTRKIVPSAMSAASAICRVVTAAPCRMNERPRGGDDRRAALVGRHARGASAVGGHAAESK